MAVFVMRSKVVGVVAWRTGARSRAGVRKVQVQLQSPVRGPRKALQGGCSRQALSAQDGLGPRSSGGCGAPSDGGAPAAWSVGTAESFLAVRSPSRIETLDSVPSIRAPGRVGE
eukprot:scaffold215_cov389-Pavlova_lutheri.AAC.8